MTYALKMELDRGANHPAAEVTLGMPVVVVRTLEAGRRHLEGREGTVVAFDWDIPILRVGNEIISGIECYWGPRKGYPGLEAARRLADAQPDTTVLVWPRRAA